MDPTCLYPQANTEPPFLEISPSPTKPDEHILTLDVSANMGKNILAEYDANASDFSKDDKALDWHRFTLEFTAKDSLLNVEFSGLALSSNFDMFLGLRSCRKS